MGSFGFRVWSFELGNSKPETPNSKPALDLRQFAAALRAATRDHGASAARGHAGAETMLARAGAAVRLISSFHLSTLPPKKFARRLIFSTSASRGEIRFCNFLLPRPSQKLLRQRQNAAQSIMRRALPTTPARNARNCGSDKAGERNIATVFRGDFYSGGNRAIMGNYRLQKSRDDRSFPSAFRDVSQRNSFQNLIEGRLKTSCQKRHSGLLLRRFSVLQRSRAHILFNLSTVMEKYGDKLNFLLLRRS
jgi:hypothetical protein